MASAVFAALLLPSLHQRKGVYARLRRAMRGRVRRGADGAQLSRCVAQSRNRDGTAPITLDASSGAVQNCSNPKHNRRVERRQSLA